MDVNGILKSLMSFINENTVLLICICVFMIFVLIGYLIDNNIKKKNVIKNDKIDTEDSQPESEIIQNNTNEENATLENDEISNNQVQNEDLVINKPQNLNVDDNKEEVIPNELEGSLDLDMSQNITDPHLDDVLKEFDVKKDDVNDNGLIDSNIGNIDLVNTTEDLSSDPDLDIMKNNSYSNSKSLLEILSEVDKEKPKVNLDIPILNDNIFGNKPDIQINTDVEKTKVDIEPKYSSEDELDNIMKRLNSINSNNNSDEDDYTNIF